MTRRVSIGMMVFYLLLAFGLVSVYSQPSGRPSGPPSSQPSAPVSPGGTGETESVPISKPSSNPVPTGSMPGRTTSPTAVSPQGQFRSWVASSSEGLLYVGASNTIEDIAQKIDRAGIPLEVIKIRMREAQAKRVGAAVFAEALEADADYWIRVATLLGEADWPPASKAPDFYIAASNALRNGVREEAIGALITWALASRGTPERAGAVLISISSLTGFMNTVEISRTAGIVAASRLRVGEFDGLAALLQRAAAAGLASSEMLEAMAAVLGGRSALRNLERRLFP